MIANLTPYPDMKDSDMEWLGAVPEHWDLRRMKTLFLRRNEKGHPNEPLLAATQTKGVVRKEHYENRTVLAMKDLHLLKLVQVNDFVISLRSFQGGIEYARQRGIISPAYTVLYPVRREDHGYLAHLFKSTPYIQNLSLSVTGIRQGQNIDYEKLSRSRLPIPPLMEQVSIVRFLDHADRRIRRYIRAKERLIKLLEEQKQAIIHRAVSGQIDVRTGQPYPAYMDSGVEWLGKVPEHWEVRRLGQLIDLTVGFPFKSDGFTQARSDVRLLRGVNVAPGTLRWDDVVRWPIRDVESFEGYEMEVGDIVLGMDRPIIQSGTRVAVVSASDVPSLLLQRVARIRVKEALRGDYAVELIGGKGFSDYLVPIFTGISVPHLSAEQVKNYRFALPNVAEQQAIMHHVASRTRSIRSAVRRILQQIHLLREYRTRLIADVVTGKLDVRGAAADLPEGAPVAGWSRGDTIHTKSHPHAIEHGMAKEAMS